MAVRDAETLPAVKARSWRNDLTRIARYLRPHRSQLLLAVVCSAATAVLNLIPALVLRSLTTDLTASHPRFSRIAVTVAVGIAAVIGAGLVNVAQTYLSVVMGKSVVAQLRRELFEHLLGQSVGFFARRRAGELMSRLLNDVGRIDATVSASLLSLLTSSLVVAASLVLMIVLSWQLTVVAIATFPIVAIAIRLAARAIYRRGSMVQEQYAEITAYLQELLSPAAMMVVKSFGRDRFERERFAATNETMRQVEIDAGMAGQWVRLVISTLRLGGPAAILLVGGWLITRNVISLATLISFAAVGAVGFGLGIQGLASAVLSVVGSQPMWRRVFEVLDEPIDITDRPGALTLLKTRGAVALRDVTFSYHGQSRPALRGVNLTVEPGQLVALVGPSGAGKSTLASLVARFYDPQQGSVTVDGHDLRDVTLTSLSDSVGLVLQDTFLFHASLEDNLRYGRPNATRDEMDAAVRAAALTGVVAALPDGYDTVLGDRGHRLSGGERQRVAIARVILKDPAILVLDEATSHLDSISESLVQAALGHLFHGRTSIVIAHRLSTVQAADLIVVLDQGTVVEQGDHRSLCRAGGLYAELYATQLSASA